MKQGLNFILPVEIGIDLGSVEKIDFIFVQDEVRLQFCYPSEKAYREADTSVIALVWTVEDTYLFRSGSPMMMDTRICLRGTTTNPETAINRLVMQPTLFKKEEILDDPSESSDE